MEEITSQQLKNFDVIVIGAGLGGLGAAAHLALKNQKVLLLEKHNSPGGFATSFVRGRFEFEGALHELNDIGTEGNRGELYHFFKALNIVPEKVKFFQVPEIYSCKFYDGKQYTLPFGVPAYTNYLINEFPNHEKEIRKLIKVMENIYGGLKNLSKPGKIIFKYPWLIRVIGYTITEFLERFIHNQRLINVIIQLWCYFGATPSENNALLWVGGMMSYLTKGAAIPNLSSHNLSQAIADSICDLGGTIRYNALVNKIMMENGKTIGVELINGEKIYSDWVISNVNPVCTLQKMIPKDAIPKKYLKKVISPKLGTSIFTVYLGLNRTAEALGITSYETFVNTSDDIHAIAQNTGINSTQMIVATCYNLVNPEISPAGTCMIALSALHVGREWHNIPPNEYYQIKDKVSNDLITLFEEYLCPNVRESIEVCESASPLTYYRYSKSLDGVIYGSNSSVDNSPVFKLGNKTPIPGLYFSGAWTNEGGGYSTALNSGRLAAKLLLKQKGKQNRTFGGKKNV
ncbi:hypothetical protein NEF87_000528 [Candidatus Lokiarchaeum ossiferum]|uniref:Amine oxidase domain-containing protein n=1 Tax=Candidatus Lokiarchaeum ossiferum TaxID=2951803 RepID=A0ABY6HL63_9ARCH|nr:hypothetical protein NEF87_000528 [Candidatus Lokiarchaeum sp. B-35]